MNMNSKLIALTTASFIALAPTAVSAASMSDGVFSWPTDYKVRSTSEAISTYDGSVLKLVNPKTIKVKTPSHKRK